MGFTPTIGDAFTIIANDDIDAVSGTFSGLAQGATVIISGGTFTISYTGGTGNDVVLTRAGPPDAATSTISGTSPVVADGVATSTITITLRDAASNPVAGLTPTFAATDTGSTNSYGACSASDLAGVSSCSLAATKAETKTLAIVGPVATSGGTVTFIAGPPDAATSTISGTSPVVADGVATATITITLRDAASNPVAGLTPTFTATDTGSTNSYGLCSASSLAGVATCTLASTTAETKTLALVGPVATSGGTVVFLPMAALTRHGCAFDLDPTVAGSTFRLIFAPRPATTWRLAGTNAGGLEYNGFAAGSPGSTMTLHITLPYPFVTKGGAPASIYDSFSDYPFCHRPAGKRIGTSSSQVTLGDYAGGFGSTTTLPVTFTFDATGRALVRVHLDYGLKGRSGYGRDWNWNATSNPTIHHGQMYAFSDDAGGGAMASSINVFKKDLGVAGLVLDGSDDPVAGATVRIYAKNVLKGTVSTDQDGWYGWVFSYRGRMETLKIMLPAYGVSQIVTITGNTFINANLTVP